MNILFKSMAIVLSLFSGLQAMEVEVQDLENYYPKEIWHEILMNASKTSGYQERVLKLGDEVSFEAVFGEFLDFRLVCKKWKDIVDNHIAPDMKVEDSWEQKRRDFWIESLVSVYGDDCRTFLNGALQYTPDVGAPILLLIADLKHPFSGQFPLSRCGNAGTYLDIRTGIRKGKITENSNKVEIYFTPKFLVDMDTKSAAHLARILPTWDHAIAPFGIFWNWGNWDNLDWFEYLTTEDINSISHCNLLNLFDKSSASLDPLSWLGRDIECKNFMLFLNKN